MSNQTQWWEVDLAKFWGVDKIKLNNTTWVFHNIQHKKKSQLRIIKWYGRYTIESAQRPIFWDMNNVSALWCCDASLHWATFSDYYCRNWLKDRVGLQLCGLLVNGILWGGGVSDPNNHNNKNEQIHFSSYDKVNRKIIPLTNGLDREQTVIQPSYTKSDKRFTGRKQLKLDV